MAILSASTIVRNVAGVETYFDFLGPRGATLDANEDMAIPGDLMTMWYRSPQKQRSLESALRTGKIEILESPSHLGFDKARTRVYMLGFNGGVPIAVDPAYGSYVGDAPHV